MVARSAPIRVGNGVQLRCELSGGALLVSLLYADPRARSSWDWVALYAAGETDNGAHGGCYAYVTKDVVSLAAPKRPGAYVVRYFQSGSGLSELAESAPVTVADRDSVTVAVAGAEATVSWHIESVANSSKDRIALFKEGVFNPLVPVAMQLTHSNKADGVAKARELCFVSPRSDDKCLVFSSRHSGAVRVCVYCQWIRARREEERRLCGQVKSSFVMEVRRRDVAESVRDALLPASSETRGRSGSGGASKVYYADFRLVTRYPHHLPLALVLAPCFALLASLGGVSTFGALVTALLAGFVLELARVKEGLLMALWISSVWVVLSFAFEVHEGGVALLLQASLLVISLAMWASLQFAWFQALLPAACVLFERLLFSMSAVNAVALLSWRAIGHFGPEAAPLVVFAVQHCVFGLLAMPRATAFREQMPGVPAAEYYIASYPEAMLTMVSYVSLPALVHAAMFRGVLFTQAHLSGFGLAVCLPLLGLHMLWPRRPLWFLEPLPRVLAAVRWVMAAVPLAVFPAALSYRVLFPSYMDDLPIPQLWAHAAMLLGLYSAVAAVAAHQMELLGPRRETLSYAAAAAAAVAACVGLGAPLWVWPFGVLAAVELLRFYFSRRARPYAAAVAAASVCLVWFLSSKLAFVTFHFARADVPLASVLGLLASVFVGAFFVLGLLLSLQPVQLTDAALAVYSAFFAVAEWLLAYGHDDSDHLYPEYLVAATSLAGMYLCHAAASPQRRFVSRAGAWTCACIWLAKSVALLCYSRDYSLTAVAVVLLVCWCVAPLAFYWDTPKNMRPAALLAVVGLAGVVALVSASSAVAQCLGSFVLPEAALRSPVVLYGGAWTLWALYSLVAALRFAPSRPLAHALALFALAAGAATVGLQPEVYAWALVFEDEETVVAVSPLAKWLLLAIVLLVLVVAALPLVRNWLRRSSVSFVGLPAGLLVAAWLSLQYMAPFGVFDEWPGALEVVFAVLLSVFGVAAVEVALVLGLQLPEARLGVRVGAAWGALLGCYLCVRQLVRVPEQLEAVRVFVLALWAVSALLLSLVLAVQSGAVLAAPEADTDVSRSRADRDARRLSAVKKHTAGDASLARVNASLTAGDVYARRFVGNVATLTCLGVSQFLALVHLDASSSVSSVALAPLLLLLSRDQRLITGPVSYYLPPLLFVAASQLLFGLARGAASDSPAKNVLLLLFLALPSLALLARASRTSTKSVFWVLFAFPGTLLTLLLADVPERVWIFALSATWTLYLFVTWWGGRPGVSHKHI
jgi:hypothetical protein